jgi:crossover junction endodeoxyribonuclease RusA
VKSLEVMSWDDRIELRVFALPAPQGSKSFKGLSKKGHAILVESSKNVKPWREAVVYAALEYVNLGNSCISGAISVEMVFTLPKPKSAPKTRRTWPDRKPDCSKLIRSTEDALVDAGVIEDDARIVDLHARKVFPKEDKDALHVPGAVIRIRQVNNV